MILLEKVFTKDELNEVAFALHGHLKNHHVIAFSGVLGSGKTTLISNLCKLIGVKDVVGSPTFSLINEYAYLEGDRQKKIFHIDAYRIESIDEARQVGVEECFDTDGFCFIEWPEHIDELLPENMLKVFLSHTDSGNRIIKVVE
jgi:tRNA threonylcarbamoyladenosine biosynthesis protein TsaE